MALPLRLHLPHCSAQGGAYVEHPSVPGKPAPPHPVESRLVTKRIQNVAYTLGGSCTPQQTGLSPGGNYCVDAQHP
jgi:hypothetical protein